MFFFSPCSFNIIVGSSIQCLYWILICAKKEQREKIVANGCLSKKKETKELVFIRIYQICVHKHNVFMPYNNSS